MYCLYKKQSFGIELAGEQEGVSERLTNFAG